MKRKRVGLLLAAGLILASCSATPETIHRMQVLLEHVNREEWAKVHALYARDLQGETDPTKTEQLFKPLHDAVGTCSSFHLDNWNSTARSGEDTTVNLQLTVDCENGKVAWVSAWKVEEGAPKLTGFQFTQK